MQNIQPYEFWFLTGSQHLYGEEALDKVQEHSLEIVEGMQQALPFPVKFKAVLTTDKDIERVVQEANAAENCGGIITWMHTFSPAKMWISGLSVLQKPLLHFHTQHNRDIPWESIDMDFMNLNQSAHGDREYGFMVSRMKISSKVVVGHWQNPDVKDKISSWMKTAAAYCEGKRIRVARFGDNMRSVAVTEGDKVEAQLKFGWTVDYFGIGDLVEEISDITENEVEALMKEYRATYHFPETAENAIQSIREQARIELGLKSFLSKGSYNAFTTNFEDLHGMKQLPGLAVQRLMAQGYGFGGEGDWKTAALLRLMKIMAGNKGTSFMEDYTYHLESGNELVLGSHMLEICPTITNEKPEIQVHPLSMGNREDPARLVFNGQGGEAVNASLVEMGGRYRLIISEVEALKPEYETPHLPVAKVMWKPKPSLSEATEAWIYAGGAHHTVFSYELTADQLYDFADMVQIECVVIDEHTKIRDFRNQLKWNEAVWN
ncbi:L-arabinose isomerase [Halobacillus salinarum]|uniref:L-arabinose isomerase n=1 Tax=Halobacillus salinarum TaxID=2932257 RepID=A0ABY4EFH1_9BACI|nr:L-arabinose isomerase [Halobacillus salinarum]UOQ43207.1 L-arabinose isomerase [Halobacillus salinarum]